MLATARLSRAATRAALLLVVVATTVVALGASLLVGSNPMPPDTVLAALFGGLESPEATVVRTQRLPRTVLGLAVGLALGAAGALMQGHTRNPLAEPGLFGVNAGAALGVVLCTYALDVSSQVTTLVAAMVGALAASSVVVAVAWSGRAKGTPVMLALTGAALGALLTAITTAIVLLDKASLDELRHWMVGSLTGRPDEMLPTILGIIGIGLLLAWANGPGVTALGLGTDVATALGNRVALIRVVGIVAITLLAATATAACGPIAFLGLVAPTIMRKWTGPHYGWLVPASALAGATLLLAADIAGRIALPRGELPVGLVLALVGAPVLIAVVSARRLARP